MIMNNSLEQCSFTNEKACFNGPRWVIEIETTSTYDDRFQKLVHFFVALEVANKLRNNVLTNQTI